MTLQGMDNVLIVVDDLEAAKTFFVELGMELEDETTMEGPWVDRIVGLENVRSEIAMMRTPDGNGRIELDKFHTPASVRTESNSTPVNTLVAPQPRSRVRRRTHHQPPHPANQESPMADTKTKPTGASVDEYLASRASPEQLTDCRTIMAICKRITKQQPQMWGPSIVGYGSYTYKYESGHSGQACLTGFAVRGRELVVYLTTEDPSQVERLAKLGKHRIGKACLYFKRLADLDVKVLESLIASSVAEVKRRYPNTGAA